MPPSAKGTSARDKAHEISNLQELLARIEKEADEGGDVTIGEIVERVGSRSFGPLLLLVGVIAASPVGGIPGAPTSVGLVVLLIAGQLIFRRRHFWLPRFILNRSASAPKTFRTLRHLRPVARFIDRLLKPRLALFTEGAASYVIAVACALIGICLPMMEMIPFSAHAAGAALTAFGLALISRDGLVALIAFIVTACTFGAAIYHMFF